MNLHILKYLTAKVNAGFSDFKRTMSHSELESGATVSERASNCDF